MAFIFSWLLAILFFMYLACGKKKQFSRIALSVIVLLSEGFLFCLCSIGYMFDDELGIAITFILMIQLIICSWYKSQNVSSLEKILGVVVLIAISIYMYFNGNVIGEMMYVISDAGGMHKKASYEVYRWSTYLFDICYIWFPVYNIIISPFWLRRVTAQHYFKRLINEIKNN